MVSSTFHIYNFNEAAQQAVDRTKRSKIVGELPKGLALLFPCPVLELLHLPYRHHTDA